MGAASRHRAKLRQLRQARRAHIIKHYDGKKDYSRPVIESFILFGKRPECYNSADDVAATLDMFKRSEEARGKRGSRIMRAIRKFNRERQLRA